MNVSAFGVDDSRISKARGQMRSAGEVDDLTKPLSVLPNSTTPGWRRPRSIFADAAPAAAKTPVKEWVNPAAGARKAAFHARNAGVRDAAKLGRVRGLGVGAAVGGAALAAGGYALGHNKSSLDQ